MLLLEVGDSWLRTGRDRRGGAHRRVPPLGQGGAWPRSPPAPLAKRFNMACMNAVVTRGQAELLVTATGMATMMGRLTDMQAEAEAEPGPTPLQL